MTKLDIIGDIIGALCVFAVPFMIITIAHGLGY